MEIYRRVHNKSQVITVYNYFLKTKCIFFKKKNANNNFTLNMTNYMITNKLYGILRNRTCHVILYIVFIK